MRYVHTITVGLFVLAFAAWLASSVIYNRNADDVRPVITADSDHIQVSVKDGTEGILKGLTASDDKDGDLTDKILVGKQSKFIEKGISEVTFLVFDAHNNVGKYTRKVEYTDYKSPEFVLSKPLVYGQDENVTILDRLTVEDSIEGDISDKIKIISGNVKKTEAGTYSIGVEASNSFGDTISAEFPINIVETTKNAPVIELNTYLVKLKAGTAFHPEAYLKQVTLADGSLAGTDDVQMDNQVDTSTEGIYQVLYSYSDVSGITGYANLTVMVEE